MPTENKKPLIVPSHDGTKIFVLGQAITVKLTSRETGGESYVFEAVTPPGVGVPPHVHQNEDEMARVLEGEFEFQVDKQTHKLTQGAVIHLPRNIPHGFRNVGTKPGKTFWAVVPGRNFEKFFEELGSLPTEQPPDMTKVTEIFAKHAIEILPAPET